jgi:predicted nucleic acid-binding protein
LITLDSSAIIALFRARDINHSLAMAAVGRARGPLVIPVAILSEAAYMLERWAGPAELDALLKSVDDAEILLDCGTEDVPRIRSLVARYKDLPLGFADSAVIACAERRAGMVLTFDRRHFPVVANEGTIQIVGAV